MLDIVLLVIGLAGFGLAGYWDLKTTEFPDWLPYSMIILALITRGIFAFAGNDWWILGNSVFVGASFLALGLVLYFAKQWGDGDAWLLGALGFIFPQQPGIGAVSILPFPLTLLFNFLLVSLVYLIAYALFLGVKNEWVNKKYLECIKKEKQKLLILSALFFAVSWCSAAVMHYWFHIEIAYVMQMVGLPFLLSFILFFSYYAKIVEKNLFKRKVKTSDLKEGDVIIDGRWRGLTRKEISELRKSGKYVWIKEGVRFAPVFIITMVISVFYGDLIFIII